VISSSDILKGSILIVDDHQANVVLLEQMLRNAGYVSITSTTNPSEVCELHRKNCYDLILLDLQMPVMDGFQVMEGLKHIETDGYLPVLVITAQPDHKLRALNAGAKDFISKPFDLAEVLIRVHNLLEVRLLHRKTKELYDQVVVEKKVSDQQLRVFRSGPVAMSITTVADERFIDVNEKYCSFSGYSREEIIGRRVMDLDVWAHPDDRTSVMHQLLKEGAVRGFEVKLRRRSGEVRDVLASFELIELAGENDRVLISTFIDITERKSAEEALKKSEERYRNFFEDDLTGDFMSTPDGEIISCNPAFARIFGFASVGEAMAYNANNLFPAPEERETFMRLLNHEKKLEYYEVEYLRRDGSSVYCVENAVGIFDASGNLAQIKGYIFDESKRKSLENQLIQAQKLESLGTLASGIAHDFNNILGIVLGYATLLTRQTSNPENMKLSIETVVKTCRRGAALVNQLLTFARKAEPELTSVKLNDSVIEISKLLSETITKTIVINLDLEQELPAISADATQMHQVLLNLCVNARDAMPNGGTLTIATHLQQSDVVRKKFPNVAARQYVALIVRDAGVGMDEKTRSRIFEPFFTTKERGKGTGLGLSVVFGIMESHKGYIAVDSEPGKGTTFYLYFPVPESQDIEQANAETQKEIPGGDETILVVEDEEAIRELLKTFLQLAGYTVLIAVDGREAIEVYDKHWEDIDLVLADNGLPKLSGYDIFRKMKSKNSKLKFILASGSVEPERISEILRDGARDFIEKPYTVFKVLRAVRSVLDHEQTEILFPLEKAG
jgi:PAS domain S-box-containing protein